MSMSKIIEIRPPVQYYVDRPVLQEKLLENTVGISVIIGVPGDGKTQLGRKVVQQQKEQAEVSKSPIQVAEEADDIYSPQDNHTIQAVEIDCRTQTGLENFKTGYDKNLNYIILLDNVITDTTDAVKEFLSQLDSSRVIITTADARLFPEYETLKINGFKLAEAETLMSNLNNDPEGCVIDSKILYELCKLLSGSPLGLKVAYAYLKLTQKDPGQYLYCLKNGIELGNMVTCDNVFSEKEYPQNLMAVLNKSIDSFQEEVQSEPLLFEALQLLAFLNKDDIPLESLGKMYGNQQHKLTDDLVMMLTKYCIGDIRKVEGQRLVSIHGAIQVALLAKLTDEEKLRALKSAAMLMCHLCHKDNRSVKDFSAQVALLQHCESVLWYIDQQACAKQSLELTICKILLLSGLAHMCTQTKRLEEGEQLLLQALAAIDHLLGGRYKILGASAEDVPEICKLLEQVGNDEDINRFLVSFIQNIRISQSDVKLWAQSNKHLERSLQSEPSLTPELYNKLVQTGYALPTEKVSRYLLAEIAATVLYTFGRLYLYTKDGSTRDNHKAALEKAKGICHYIEKHFDVRLLHTELVERNGLVSFYLEQDQDTDQCSFRKAQKAAKACQDILDNTTDRFEFGLLKAKRQDTYRELICNREEIKAMTICLNIKPNADIEKTALNSVDKIESRLKELSEQGVTLHRESTYPLTIGYLMLALKLPDSAKDHFLQACNLEKMHVDSVNHPWLDALYGLLKVHQQCQRDEKELLDELQIYIHHLEKFHGIYSKEQQEACRMLLSVDPKNDDIREMLRTLLGRLRTRSTGFSA